MYHLQSKETYLQQRQRKLNFFSRGSLTVTLGAQRVPFQVLGAVQTIILRQPQLCSTGLGSKNKVDLESKTICSNNKSCLYLFKRNPIFPLSLRLNLGRLSLYAQINCQELLPQSVETGASQTSIPALGRLLIFLRSQLSLWQNSQ